MARSATTGVARSLEMRGPPRRSAHDARENLLAGSPRAAPQATSKDAKALLDQLNLLFLRIRFCGGTAENLSNSGLYELSKSRRDLDH